MMMIVDPTPGDTGWRRLDRKKWLGAFALVAILGCLALRVCIAWPVKNYEPFTARDYYPTRPDSDTVSSIEGNAEIDLPSSAHGIYAYTTGLRDIFTRVRFSMNADELDEFMLSTLCQQPLKEIQPGEQSAREYNRALFRHRN